MRPLFLLAAGLAALQAFGAPALSETLRIGLVSRLKDASEVAISSTGDFKISNSSGRLIASCGLAERVALKKKDGRLEVARQNGETFAAQDEIRFTSSSSDWIVVIPAAGRPVGEYRGAIAARAGDRGILLVNVVDMEDYLVGVLPAEMPSGFKPEALKAQAVAARSFALANRGKHGKLGYDLCDGDNCQAYLGAAGEKPATTDAVRQTAGLVAVYGGRPIRGQYCNDCGGVTQDGGETYLVPVADHPEGGGPDYCAHNDHAWTKSWKLEEFEKLLQRSYPQLKGVTGVRVKEQDSSGRAKTVKIDAGVGGTTISGARLRSLLGNAVMKSTLFTARMENGCVIFEGKGSGHGIGLCQRGANTLASPPYNYTFEQIIKHYYSGVEIAAVGSFIARAGSRSIH